MLPKTATEEFSPRTHLPTTPQHLSYALVVMTITEPDLTGRPYHASAERLVPIEAAEIYEAWTTDRIERWFAAPGTALMKPQVNSPFFFETRFDGQRHPHYGRFLKLEPNHLIQLTWLTAAGTKGAETVVTIYLESQDKGTRISLKQEGFPEKDLMQGHADAWPMVLEHLEKSLLESD